jgi:hypothetical protein
MIASGLRNGSLGINDLEKFGRPLRLGWLWNNRDTHDWPWKIFLRPQDKTYRALFFVSTLISVGDNKNTQFWEARWMNETSPKELAPNLYS